MELRERLVEGAFDADHLSEINRRIFQDLPDLGFTAVRPGAFREPVASTNRDWIKQRNMEDLPHQRRLFPHRCCCARPPRTDAGTRRPRRPCPT